MKKYSHYIILISFLLTAALCQAQEPDSLQNNLRKELDSLTQVNNNLLNQLNKMEQKMERLEEKQKFYEEKESFYKVEAMRDLRENNEKLLREKDKYQRLSDSLQLRLNETEKVIIRTNEELKYTQQRAKDAEARISNATARKKKVCAIQGIAMKTFRTPSWSLAPDKIVDEEGNVRVGYKIVNKNGALAAPTCSRISMWDLLSSFSISSTLPQASMSVNTKC